MKAFVGKGLAAARRRGKVVSSQRTRAGPRAWAAGRERGYNRPGEDATRQRGCPGRRVARIDAGFELKSVWESSVWTASVGGCMNGNRRPNRQVVFVGLGAALVACTGLGRGLGRRLEELGRSFRVAGVEAAVDIAREDTGGAGWGCSPRVEVAREGMGTRGLPRPWTVSSPVGMAKELEPGHRGIAHRGTSRWTGAAVAQDVQDTAQEFGKGRAAGGIRWTEVVGVGVGAGVAEERAAVGAAGAGGGEDGGDTLAAAACQAIAEAAGERNRDMSTGQGSARDEAAAAAGGDAAVPAVAGAAAAA